jgi:hypothetical protein
MTTPITSRPVFFQSFAREKPEIRYAWLRYWIFSDEGAAVLPHTTESLSLEDRQKEMVLV